MFIRIKKINNKNYAYLVKNSWTQSGPRQKVSRYLGKAIIFEKKIQELQSDPELEKAFTQFINQGISEYAEHSKINKISIDLVKFELSRRGFTIKENICTRGLIKVNLPEETVKIGKSNAVLSLNDGFLCNHTLNALLNYSLEQGKTEDELAFQLANTFVEAGIRVPKKLFITIFEKLIQNNA